MSGMHGANRLASNSLLEAVVMAKLAARKSLDYFKQASFPEQVPVDNSLYSSLKQPREKILITHDRRQLTRIMSDFVGIVRSEKRLRLALEKIEHIREAVEQFCLATPATYNVLELRNMATVADLIIRSALERKESRGLHYVEEYPESSDDYLRDTIIEGAKRDR
jgi:L-aspartate oxidase